MEWKVASPYLALTVNKQELVRDGVALLVAIRKYGQGRKLTGRSPIYQVQRIQNYHNI